MAMTRTLALDHARDNIRVNCVAPGSVHTPLLEQAAIRLSPTDAEETMRQWGAKHPLGWLAEPEDIADVFVFLASDASRYMTGTTLVVDGGLLARLGV
jgi:NAD(P)-dependent dehydrogenase (short-subunit alcohol dehydrogenase family)